MTKSKIKERVAAALARLEEREREARRERDEPTGRHCFCGAEVVRRLRHTRTTRIGRSQSGWGPRPSHSGYHCAGCGIEYHKPPPVRTTGEEQ